MVGRSACKLFVEGGGDRNAAQKAECRRGFHKLLEKAGFKNRMPRIFVCGGRQNAFDQFCTAVRTSSPTGVAVLLVDAEAPVTEMSPWRHVADRPGDNWPKPDGAKDDHLHLMVQCMESWFLADREALRVFFGQGFRGTALPASTKPIEMVTKSVLFNGLRRATEQAKTKGAYRKGKHSFKLLAEIDPQKVRKASPWAERFFSSIDKLL